MRVFKTVVGLACALAAMSPQLASACSIIVPGPFELAGDGSDTVPPSGIQGDIEYQVYRGRGAVMKGDSCMWSSCDDIGEIAVGFEAALDDRSPPEKETKFLHEQEGVGYYLTVESGTVPNEFALDPKPTAMFMSDGEAWIALVWIDAATNEQEAFSFELGIQPVDLDGNVGPKSVVLIEDPGTSGPDPCASPQDTGDGDEQGGGCEMSSPGVGQPGRLLALMVFAALRSRRTRGPREFAE